MSSAEIVIQAGWLRTAPSGNLHPEKVANDDRIVCHDRNPSSSKSCVAQSFQVKNRGKKWFERGKINGSLGRLSRAVGYAEIRYGVDGLKQLMSWALFLWTKQQRIAKAIFIGTFSIEILLIYYRLKSVKSFVSYWKNQKPNVHITLPPTVWFLFFFRGGIASSRDCFLPGNNSKHEYLAGHHQDFITPKSANRMLEPK